MSTCSRSACPRSERAVGRHPRPSRRRRDRSRGRTLFPVDLQRFRLVTGAPIYVDFKSVPYLDTEVIEWHHRMRRCEAWYDGDWTALGRAQELRDAKITHIVTPASRPIEVDWLRKLHSDSSYILYRVAVTPDSTGCAATGKTGNFLVGTVEPETGPCVERVTRRRVRSPTRRVHHHLRGKPMQYMILIYEDEKKFASLSEAEMNKVFAEYMQYSKDLAAAGVLNGGAALQPVATATTVRVRGGKTATTDGPFAETKEQLGGYYIIDVANLDEAIKWAAKCPGSPSGSIEVRPLGLSTEADGSIAGM